MVAWNQYLFEKVLPKAWVRFLRELPLKVPNIHPDDVYKFWPIIKKGASGSIITFCQNLLQNVIENLGVKDRVFKGPSSLNVIGKVPENLANSYDASSFKKTEFHWLSLSNGYLSYLKDNDLHDLLKLLKVIGDVGFPIISVPNDIIVALKNSKHQDFLKVISPAIIRIYLKHNRERWQDKVLIKDVIELFKYIFKNENFDDMDGLKMIPLVNGELGTLSRFSNSYIYVNPDNDERKNVAEDIFKNQLNKFVSKTEFGLCNILREHVKVGWNLNIKILDEFAVADMIRFSLNSENPYDEEIQISNKREWIYKLWNYLIIREWDLKKFEDIHLIPTSRSTLRKLNTTKKIFSNQTNNNISIAPHLKVILEKFGAAFVDNKFDELIKYDK